MTTKVPAIPSITSRNLDAALRAVKSLLDVREGRVGDPLDANVTFRDLVSAGVAQLPDVTGGGAGGTPVLPPLLPGSDGYDPEADETPPPQPVGFTATAGLALSILEWDPHDATLYRNHAHVEVWRAATDAIGDAVMIGTSDSQHYVDPVGITGATHFYWIRFISRASVAGPYNDTAGAEVTTGMVGNADLGPLIVEAANLAAGAVDLGSTTVTGTITDPARFGALAVGYTVTQYLVATSGLMGNLVVDNAQIANISAAKLTVGDGTIGGQLKSSIYTAGSAGWVIKPDGTAEFNNVTVRGTVHSVNGTFDGQVTIRDPGGAIIFQSGGNLDYSRVGGTKPPSNATNGATFGSNIFGQINSGNVSTYIAAGAIGNAYIGNFIQSTNFNGTIDSSGNITANGTLGWAIGKGGKIVAQDAYIRGNVQATSLNAATGTFSGSLSAATGTFSGTLTAAAISAVNSINIAGNAVMVLKGVSADYMNMVNSSLTIAAADIPSGHSTVPVIVTSSWHISASYVIAVGYNTTGVFNGVTANIFAGQPGIGAHATTKIVNLGVGTYYFRTGYADGTSKFATDTASGDGNAIDTSMTLILGKR